MQSATLKYIYPGRVGEKDFYSKELNNNTVELIKYV